MSIFFSKWCVVAVCPEWDNDYFLGSLRQSGASF